MFTVLSVQRPVRICGIGVLWCASFAPVSIRPIDAVAGFPAWLSDQGRACRCACSRAVCECAAAGDSIYVQASPVCIRPVDAVAGLPAWLSDPGRACGCECCLCAFMWLGSCHRCCAPAGVAVVMLPPLQVGTGHCMVVRKFGTQGLQNGQSGTIEGIRETNKRRRETTKRCA